MGRIRVGKPDVKIDAPSSVPGIDQGNKGSYRGQPGHHADGTADARRSTGIHWKGHGPMLEIMPSISPG